MKRKHTPGPWTFEFEDELPSGDYQCSIFPKIDNEVEEIAVCWGKTEEEAKANAKLIAAAPELFKMLEDALHTIKVLNNANVLNGGVSQDTIIAQIEETIKKATE